MVIGTSTNQDTGTVQHFISVPKAPDFECN